MCRPNLDGTSSDLQERNNAFCTSLQSLAVNDLESYKLGIVLRYVSNNRNNEARERKRKRHQILRRMQVRHWNVEACICCA